MTVFFLFICSLYKHFFFYIGIAKLQLNFVYLSFSHSLSLSLSTLITCFCTCMNSLYQSYMWTSLWNKIKVWPCRPLCPTLWNTTVRMVRTKIYHLIYFKAAQRYFPSDKSFLALKIRVFRIKKIIKKKIYVSQCSLVIQPL